MRWLREHAVLLGFMLMFLAGPIVLAGTGVSIWMQEKELAQRGVEVAARIVDRFNEGDDGNSRYMLLLSFEHDKTELRTTLEVSKGEWLNADPGQTITLTIDPEEPALWRRGAPDEFKRKGVDRLIGGVLLGIGMTVAIVVFG